ncbi:CocE/NonD family hydrolase [Massilia terrae]|uniref:CocE/NonD family hydrolase n=1 Tax=Massilia terrae TaxID=1811224 RepID=A0ABT2CUG6_9BURK|nr:CocE/NonD family hydrolase [Massilia terrae]MCS0656840.1 CocE/NonD family hydrolase [Massilia terrae]
MNHFVLHDVAVPMRDGCRLAADVYLPDDGSGCHPVLLERTPYNKLGTNHGDRSKADPAARSKPEIAAMFARAGYVVVVQDCRGRYASEGGFTKYVNESEDGADTIDWLMRQPWCNGRIGSFGLSYGAHVQSAMAALAPRGLSAMFLDSGGFSSAFHSGIRQGGAFELKQLTWAVKHARLARATAADPARKAALDAQDIRDWIGVTPWSEGHSPLAAAPEYEQYVLQQWRSEVFDECWKSPALCARAHYAEWADVPMVHMSSWFDPYALTAVENYAGLARLKRSPVKLVLGPWTHGQRSVTFAGDVDFGPAATLDDNIAPDYTALRQAWFDRHLRGDDSAPDYLPQPVKIFVMGGGSGRKDANGRLQHGGHWRDEADWPPPSTTHTVMHLHGDGSLAALLPQAECEALEYDFDPRDPVPTIGGAIASGAPVMFAGAYDQRTTPAIFGAKAPFGPLADRPDVLVFQTAPLAEAVEVTGQLVARLWVSSSALDTDFTIKLLDVYPPSADYPEGCAINLTHGILRMRFRDSFEHPTLLEPDAVYQIEIPTYPTSNLFAAGHRIRIDISSSNFPHFDVNPNTGAPAGTVSEPVVAHNRLFVGHGRPSAILLPVIP